MLTIIQNPFVTRGFISTLWWTDVWLFVHCSAFVVPTTAIPDEVDHTDGNVFFPIVLIIDDNDDEIDNKVRGVEPIAKSPKIESLLTDER